MCWQGNPGSNRLFVPSDCSNKLCLPQVSLQYDLLSQSGGVDQRMPLLPVDDDTEVTGQVQFDISLVVHENPTCYSVAVK